MGRYDREKPRQDNVSKFLQKDGVELFIGRIKNRPNPTGDSNPQLSRPIVSAETPYGAVNACSNPTGYSGLAMMSLDGLLRPISLTGEGGLSRYGKYFLNTGSKSNSYAPHPPVINGTGSKSSLSYNLEISQQYLNPIINPLGYGLVNFTGRYASGSGGHDIEILAQRPTGLPNGQSLMTCIGSGSGLGHKDTYSEDYRLLALRGPVLIQQWGYDINGKPIPNEVDTYANASTGNFTQTNLRDRFMPDFMQKSKTWPVGPIDLRWDRQRGCWVSPQQYRLVRAMSLSDIAPLNTGRCYLTDGETIYNLSGTAMNYSSTPGPNRAEVIAKDKVGEPIVSGSRLLLYYDAQQSEYHIVESVDDSIIPLVATTTGFNSIGNSLPVALSGQKILTHINSLGSLCYSDTSSAYGPNVIITNDLRPIKYPVLPNYVCWAKKSYCTVTNKIQYELIDAQRPANFIYFTVTGGLTTIPNHTNPSATHFSDAGYPIDIKYGWQGETPTIPCFVKNKNDWTINIIESGDKGIAILDERNFVNGDGFGGNGPSTNLVYTPIHKDTVIKIGSTGCNTSTILNSEYKTNKIYFGNGLKTDSFSRVDVETPKFGSVTGFTANNNYPNISGNDAIQRIYIGKGLYHEQTSPSGCQPTVVISLNLLAQSSGTGNPPSNFTTGIFSKIDNIAINSSNSSLTKSYSDNNGGLYIDSYLNVTSIIDANIIPTTTLTFGSGLVSERDASYSRGSRINVRAPDPGSSHCAGGNDVTLSIITGFDGPTPLYGALSYNLRTGQIIPANTTLPLC